MFQEGKGVPEQPLLNNSIDSREKFDEGIHTRLKVEFFFHSNLIHPGSFLNKLFISQILYHFSLEFFSHPLQGAIVFAFVIESHLLLQTIVCIQAGSLIDVLGRSHMVVGLSLSLVFGQAFRITQFQSRIVAHSIIIKE